MADIQIKGRLGRDAEMRFTQGGDALLSFSVADDLRRKSPSGEWETASTTWWPVTVWGREAESLVDHLKKGVLVLVVGTVHERKFEHNGEQRSSFDVKARTVAVVPRDSTPRQSAPTQDPWASEEVPF